MESKTGDGVLTTGAGSGGAGSGNSGGNISVQELMQALARVPPAGKKPPRLEGRSLTKGNVKAFLQEYDDYCHQMRRGADGEVPRNPVGVLELLGCAQRRVVMDSQNDGMELTNESCLAALRKMAGLVNMMVRD